MAPTVLCYVTDPIWKPLVECALQTGEFRAQWASDAPEARNVLQSGSPRVFLADAGLALDERFDLLGCARQLSRPPVTGLIGDQEIEEQFFALRRNRVGVFFARRPAPEVEELRRDLVHMVKPEASFGLEGHLPEGATVERRAIHSLADKNALVEMVCQLVERHGRRSPSVFDIRLASEEILNNAIMHAFRRPDGTEKYALRDFKRLEEGEEIKAAFGAGEWGMALSVRDNQGNLRFDTILEKLHRQMSLIGLMDVNGRGLYLSLTLATRLVIALDPGRATEIMVIFDARARAPGKSLCVFETTKDFAPAGDA